MFTAEYENLHEMLEALTRRVALAKTDELDHINAADVQVHDIMVRSKTCFYEMDLKDHWHAKTRWTTLVRQYIDPVALEAWLDLIEDRMKGGKRGQAFMRSKSVASRGSVENTTRRWGSCIIGFGFRMIPQPSLSMHSRTTFLGYIAPLDIAVAYHLAKLLADRLDIGVGDIAFVWNLENAQFHSSRSLGWWFTQDKNYLEADYSSAAVKARPGLASAIRQFRRYVRMDEEGVLYGDLSYASQLRPRKRWHTEVMGAEYGKTFEGGTRLNASSAKVYKPLPSVPVDKLNFDPIKNREGDEANAEFAGECEHCE